MSESWIRMGSAPFLSLLSLLLLLLTPSEAQNLSNGSKIIFNGTDVLMELSGPIRVNVYAISDKGSKLGSLIERVDLRTTVQAAVETSLAPGENATLISSITVNYTNIDCSGLINNQSKISGASLSMAFSMDKIRWSLVKLSTSLLGSIAVNSSIPLSGEEIALRPYLRSGYTPSEADRAYGRAYTTGSPSKQLSWYCNYQEFFEDPSTKSPGGIAISLEFPGLQLQPFDNATNANGTKTRFGYSWNCDPLISAKIWEVLFIVLILLFIFLWSVQMMLNLNTPSRFDDPKGKPLSVPLHE